MKFWYHPTMTIIIVVAVLIVGAALSALSKLITVLMGG